VYILFVYYEVSDVMFVDLKSGSRRHLTYLSTLEESTSFYFTLNSMDACVTWIP
jgi:hypothetical protein